MVKNNCAAHKWVKDNILQILWWIESSKEQLLFDLKSNTHPKLLNVSV